MESTLSDVKHIFNDDLTAQALKCFKIFKISEDTAATVLEFLRLHAVITKPIKIFEERVNKKRPSRYQKTS